MEFRGGKGNLYEGGLRIPFLVRWPGKIAAGQVNGLRFAQYDLLATLTELCGAKTPEDTDGISILPTLLGQEAVGRKQKEHPYLYWEFGNMMAVRMNNWKGLKIRNKNTWELYDLSKDPSETTNLAAQQSDFLGKMMKIAEQCHTPARPGTYSTRERHERDRWAKWGTPSTQGALVSCLSGMIPVGIRACSAGLIPPWREIPREEVVSPEPIPAGIAAAR